MIFDVTLFTWHLFKNLEQKLKEKGCNSFRAAPSIRPSSNLFSSIPCNFDSYVKFIQSTYRVDVNGHTFYFFFRNCRNPDGSFTWPSSLEVVKTDYGIASTLFKYHYFANKDHCALPSQPNPDYTDINKMKADIKVLSDFFTNEFISKI